MRVVVQRVTRASIRIEGGACASMENGLVVLMGVEQGDALPDVSWLANKCLDLRVFEDGEGKMNRSLRETGGSILIVSQFTLFGNVRKGNRPSFNRSALPEQAIPVYEEFVRQCREQIGHGKVLTGAFGAHMEVELTNDGPVTLIIDSKDRRF